MCIVILRFLSSATIHQGLIMHNAFIIHRHVHMCIGSLMFLLLQDDKDCKYSGTINSKSQDLINC